MIRSIVFIACCYLCITACNKMRCEPEMPRLTTVFKDDTYQLTGVAISPEGRLFTSFPLWPDINKHAVVEIDGKVMDHQWVNVQAVVTDEENNLWVVDLASSHILVKINLHNNTIEKTYSFEGAGANTYINDVRIDNQRQYAYLTNSNEGGIVVLNLATGNMRQVLQDHYSTKSDPGFKFIIDGRELMKNGQPVKINADGIALTPDGEWLYYKPLTDDKLYRIRTEYLRDETMSSAQLGSQVEDLGHFAPTAGMIFDHKGNLYIGDMRNNSIQRITPELKMERVIVDAQLIWPDGYSISKDGWLYISCSQIQKQPEYNEGINKRNEPYAIYKLKIE